MYDLIALAFQTDSTRVVTYVVRTELAGGVYPEFGVSKGYHELSHHGNDPQNLDALAKVDTIYMTHWSYFLNRLASIRDGDGTLLDHTMLGFSSGMGIGHSKAILPTVLSGGNKLGIRHQTHITTRRQYAVVVVVADDGGEDGRRRGGGRFRTVAGVIQEVVA